MGSKNKTNTFNLPSRRSFWASASRFAIGLAYTRGPRCSDAVIGRDTSEEATGGGTGVGAAATGAGAAGAGADGAAAAGAAGPGANGHF